MDRSGDELDLARVEAGLTQSDLWLRYFALGGMTSALELEAALVGALVVDPRDRDRIAHALNERFWELGSDRRLRYSDEPPELSGP